MARLDVGGFWEPLTQQLDRMVTVGLLKPANRGILATVGSPEEALEVLAGNRP